jgi:hypothetical protein
MHNKPNGEKKRYPPSHRRRRWVIFLRAFLASFVASILLSGLGMLSTMVLITASPSIGAQGADRLRSLAGNALVAELEEIVLTLQDASQQLLYRAGVDTPVAPWGEPTTHPVSLAGSSNASGALTLPGNEPPLVQEPGSPGTQPAGFTQAAPYAIPAPTDPTRVLSTPDQSSLPRPADLPFSKYPWLPASLPRLGNLPNEGLWQAYIQLPDGVTVAYRTFLQPDPARPYAVVGIVALDLTQVRLHYQLGTEEPASSVSLARSGAIPEADKQPGILLAAFNGGFLTQHGYFGVMADGIQLVPPIDGIGTLVMYQDGSLRMGEWGTDLFLTPDVLFFRQNCPLIVHDGLINPLVYNNWVNMWGGTIKGEIVTFRSGIGISQDGRALYYFAGKSLNMPSLGTAMQVAGAFQAMQLDINDYYVHFTRFEVQDSQLVAGPLLPNEMVDNIKRYLAPYPRDFFYVTAIR